MKDIGKKLRIIWRGYIHSWGWKLVVASYFLAIVGGLGLSWWQGQSAERVLVAQVGVTSQENAALNQLASEYEELKSRDPYAENDELKNRQKEIKQAYDEASSLFELRADMIALGEESEEIELLIARLLSEIGAESYATASATIEEVTSEINKLFPTPAPVVVSGGGGASSGSELPGSGYARISVSTERGTFTVAAVVAPGSRMVVETAGESDCSDNCPTKSLAEHVANSGGFAGINGAYFCPPDYAQCQGKTSTFDTLAVNGRTKAVLNRDNNVYSTVPLVAGYGGSISFYDRTLDWGVDTGSNGALANYPRLVRDGEIANSDENGKGARGFIGVKDGSIVIGHVYSASFGDTAVVLKALGLSNAMNLDGGGSSALYYEGGYKVGPGRSLPTAVVLVR